MKNFECLEIWNEYNFFDVVTPFEIFSLAFFCKFDLLNKVYDDCIILQYWAGEGLNIEGPQFLLVIFMCTLLQCKKTLGLKQGQFEILNFYIPCWTKICGQIFSSAKIVITKPHYVNFVRFLPDFCIKIFDKTFVEQNCLSTKLKFLQLWSHF